MAPINSAFQQYREARARGEVQIFSEEGRPLGCIPDPFDRSYLDRLRFNARQTMQGEPLEVAGALPASYDLRTLDEVTPVRDQGEVCGSCWIFGPYASLESWLKKRQQSWDFAEADMNDYHGFDFPSCEGGTRMMATAYLTRWDGPVNESDYPYFYTAPGVPIVQYVQDVRWVPRSGPLDNDPIKLTVMQEGAVSISFFWDESNFNSHTNSYYYAGSEGTNHCVAIVGWDDNYPKNKFQEEPPGNGAFIIKNSWGTGFADRGYFYLSYYDTSLSWATSYYNPVPPQTYVRNYEYDPLGLVGSIGFGAEKIWIANIFIASTSVPRIKAVSTYALTDNTTYVLDIYRNVESGQPTSGRRVVHRTGTLETAGYHTITLKDPAVLTAGKTFSVVMELNTPGYLYPGPVEQRMQGYSSAASSAPGQSFVSCDGREWLDLYEVFPDDFMNANIKAFGIAAAK